MSRIRSVNTKPEKTVRSFLHKAGFRFRLHDKNLPGRPDIVLRKYRTAVFVHGCYWHRHPGCRFAYTPGSRLDFWNRKFTENVKRDKVKKRALENSGWKVIVIWECETGNHEILRKRLLSELR